DTGLTLTVLRGEAVTDHTDTWLNRARRGLPPVPDLAVRRDERNVVHVERERRLVHRARTEVVQVPQVALCGDRLDRLARDIVCRGCDVRAVRSNLHADTLTSRKLQRARCEERT